MGNCSSNIILQPKKVEVTLKQKGLNNVRYVYIFITQKKISQAKLTDD